MTVDLEDYFQVSALETRIPREEWERVPGRVEASTERVLRLFDEHGIHATFFALGWVAQRYPNLVRRIAAAGHEVASHGFGHVRATRQQPAEFREDVARTKGLLEDLTGREVRGFRAPSFSIEATNMWALDVLQEVGYRYSSSIYPISHDHYGMPAAPRFAFRHRDGGLLEIPITTVRLFNRNIPTGGGGYFRLFPYALSRWALRRVNRREGQAAVFYFHPWELDPEQPRQAGLGFKTRFRHYLNLERMEARLQRLLRDFRWGSIEEVFPGDGERALERAGSRKQSA
jgi:polysaccharide deacetylase family protein (PEP-CTERM system associated)